MRQFLDDGKGGYNGCHFWSNFEIGDLRFFQSQPFLDYFRYLDKAGGFFYERWGDAPVHSIAASLFLQPEQIHFFNDIGYYHAPFIHCPREPFLNSQCYCDPAKSITFDPFSCTPHFLAILKERHEKPHKKEDLTL